MTPGAIPAIETHVRQLWSEILGVTSIAVTDDFFDLGGQSLDLVRFLLEVRSCYHVDLPVDELVVEEFTVAAAARAIESCRTGAAQPGPVVR